MISETIKYSQLYGGMEQIVYAPQKYVSTTEYHRTGVPDPYSREILSRIREIKKSAACQHIEERFQSISGSLKVKEQFRNQENILIILDDVKTTGISILEAKKVLQEGNIKNILVIAFGINNHRETELGGGVWKII